MTPNNINSIAGAMGSILGNNQPQGTNPHGPNANPMGMLGNLFQNLMGSLGDDSEDEDFNVPNAQNNDNNAQNKPAVNNEKKDDLIKKLVDSPHLRRETKINNEEKIGEKIEPNIESSQKMWKSPIEPVKTNKFGIEQQDKNWNELIKAAPEQKIEFIIFMIN